MSDGTIAENYRRVRESIPDNVTIVAAAKTRSADQIREAVEAGVDIIGENYVQEAQRVYEALGEDAGRVQWHMIGHLQRNKINKALPVFDLIQTVDSPRLARGLDKRVESELPVFMQVNVAGEESKYGVPVEEAWELAEVICDLPKLRLEGLMTMEPYFEDPEKARPYFRRMKDVFDEMKENDELGRHLSTLSMGMTNSYRVAVDEGATMVRVGTAIFGPRR